jgi:hypothetical protein
MSNVTSIHPRLQENTRHGYSGCVGEGTADSSDVGVRKVCVAGIVDDVQNRLHGDDGGGGAVLRRQTKTETESKNKNCDGSSEKQAGKPGREWGRDRTLTIGTTLLVRFIAFTGELATGTAEALDGAPVGARTVSFFSK